MLRRGAAPEAAKLGKYEPDPMGAFTSRPQFVERRRVNVVLGVDETAQIERIVIGGHRVKYRIIGASDNDFDTKSAVGAMVQLIFFFDDNNF